MKNQELTMELYDSPMKERNEENIHQGADNCICCARKMKAGEVLFVHINENGMAVNPQIVTDENCKELTGADSQGAFPIGNSCAKKMKGFTFTMQL